MIVVTKNNTIIHNSKYRAIFAFGAIKGRDGIRFGHKPYLNR